MSGRLIYIAAPWNQRHEMYELAKEFEDAGHHITHKWWEFDDGSDESNPAFLRECAINDACGVIEADVLVLLNSSKSEGKAVEQGIAIAEGKKVIAIGTRGELSKNVFHYMDNYIWVPTVKEALKTLDGLNEFD